MTRLLTAITRLVLALTVALFMAVVLALALAPVEAPAQTTVRTDAGSFEIPLPPDWVAIPTLELYLFEHHGHAGPVPPEELARFRRTRMGFQKPAEKWFTTPYLVISLEDGRKRTPQDLFMDFVLAEKDAEAAAPATGYKFLEKEQEPTKRMYHYKDTSYSPVLGQNVEMGMFTYLTSQGFLKVAWFIAEDQRAQYEEELNEAGMRVTLSPELEYKPEKKQ